MNSMYEIDYNNGMNCNNNVKRADAPTITLALVKWLDKKYEDKTITTEISLNTSFGVKIADVVVSNGHAIAYEVKSEFDTTQRLDGQIKGYSEIFEYVNLVYWGDKFNVEKLSIPENIGLIRAYWKNSEIAFKIERKARINRSLTPLVVGHFLWKSELRHFLKQKSVKCKISDDKETLVKLFNRSYGKKESVQVFRFVLKNRFKIGFDLFEKLNDLKAFKKKKVDINYILNI